MNAPRSAEVKNEWSYTSTATIGFNGIDRDRFNSKRTSAALDVAVIVVLVPLLAVNWRQCAVLLLLGASVCPQRTTRLPLDKFSRNLIFEDFSKLSKKFKLH